MLQLTKRSGRRHGVSPHRTLCRGAGGDAIKTERLERRQHAAVERSGEGGAPGVGDPGAAALALP